MTVTPRPLWSRGFAVAALTGFVATGLAPTAAQADDDTVDTLYSFEDGTSDHVQWGAAGAGVERLADSGLASFSSAPNAAVLSYGFDLGLDPHYGGIGFEYTGSRPAQNWSASDGVQFWLHSDGSGSSIQVEIVDATSATATVGDRWDTVVPLGSAGWHLVRIPFSQFSYATDHQDAGAPNDGTLDLSFVRGLLFPANSGAATVKLDEIGLYTGASDPTDPTDPTDPDEGGTAPTGRVIEDFESDLRRGDPSAVPALGWFTAQGAGNVPTFDRVADAERPSAAADNDVLDVGFDTRSWAVLVDAFTPDGQTWVPQDWSAFTGVGFWMKGTGSGAPLFFDLIDNRNPDSTVDDAERFSTRFVDDVAGWRFIELPFADFTRKNIGNGAPDDGLTLTDVHGFGIGVEQSSPVVAPDLRFDDVTLFGTADPNRPIAVNPARAVFTVEEGADAQVGVRLSRTSDTDVTVSWRTEAATERTSTEDLPATPDRDYVSGSGTVTIPAGSREATITVPTIDDGKDEVDETFLVRFSDAVNAQLGTVPVARVSITDNDAPVDGLIDDFENGTTGLDGLGEAGLATREIAASAPDAYPGQDSFENVLDVTGAGGYAHRFAQPQDWSAKNGLGFWYDGRGDGSRVTVGLDDGAGAGAAAQGSPEDWVLQWSDEFDGAAGTPADPRYWTYETGGWGWGNDELQYYTDSTENAAHDGNGNMVITTRAVDDPAASGLSCWYGPCKYTSARLITEDKYTFQHGRVEVRAKMPDGEAGIWPAIWSLGDDFREVGWPQTGEIDIMEYVGKLPTEIFGTIHGPGYSGGQSFGGTHDFGTDLSNQWLTFSVEWEQGQIRWYVQRDGGERILFHTATPQDVAPNEWVYEHPFFLLMNMAVGGNFGGALSSDLTFPQELAVDYIRVYQAPDAAERFETTFVDDQAGWRWVELPFAGFSRAGEQPEGAADDGLGLTAVTGYQVEVAGTASTGPVSIDRVRLLNAISATGGSGTTTAAETTAPTAVRASTVTTSAAAVGTAAPAALASTGAESPLGGLAVAAALLGVGVFAGHRVRRRRLG